MLFVTFYSKIQRNDVSKLVSLPPHKFVLPSCCYCRLYEIMNSQVTSNGITLITNFVKINVYTDNTVIS